MYGSLTFIFYCACAGRPRGPSLEKDDSIFPASKRILERGKTRNAGRVCGPRAAHNSHRNGGKCDLLHGALCGPRGREAKPERSAGRKRADLIELPISLRKLILCLISSMRYGGRGAAGKTRADRVMLRGGLRWERAPHPAYRSSQGVGWAIAGCTALARSARPEVA